MALRIDPTSVTDPNAVQWLRGLPTFGYDVGSGSPTASLATRENRTQYVL